MFGLLASVDFAFQTETRTCTGASYGPWRCKAASGYPIESGCCKDLYLVPSSLELCMYVGCLATEAAPSPFRMVFIGADL